MSGGVTAESLSAVVAGVAKLRDLGHVAAELEDVIEFIDERESISAVATVKQIKIFGWTCSLPGEAVMTL